MASARVIVCEASSRWAVALRRHLPPEIASRLLETRLLEDCWREAIARPASLVALEVTGANLEQVARALASYRTQVPRTSVVVVASRRLAAAQWLLRELGALHVSISTRAVESLVRLVERHWQTVTAAEAALPTPLWRRLPWGTGFADVESGPAWKEPAWLAPRGLENRD